MGNPRPAPQPSAPRRRGGVRFLPALGAAFVWAWGPVLIDVLGRAGFDAHSQNLYRYLAAVVFLVPIAALARWRAFVRALRAWPRFVAPAAAVTVFQTAWVMAIYRTTPTVAAFAEHSALVFGILGSAMFYADERRLVLSRRFAVAATVIVVGFTGVVFGKPAAGGSGPKIEGELGLGVVFLAVGAIGWASYALLVKRVLLSFRSSEGGAGARDGGGDTFDRLSVAVLSESKGGDVGSQVGPSEAFAVTLLIATVILLFVALAAGDVSHVARVEAKLLVVLFVSGVICVGVGQGLYFFSIRLVGVAASQVVTVAAPFLTGVIAFAVTGSRMSLLQWLSGTLLASGVAYLMLARAPRPK